MGSAIILAGITVFCFILVYMFFKLNDIKIKNPDGNQTGTFLLQLLVLLFLLSSIVLLGKATLDARNECAFINSSTTVDGATTNYNYTYICEEDTRNTVNIFYYLIMGFVSILFLYLSVMFVYSVLTYLGWVVPK